MTDKNLLVITPHRKEPGKQRIAAYCRASSRSDEQLNSLANQIDFYRSRFENDDTVVFVGIYVEEGLSGTQAQSRPQFMKMIEDCRSGLISVRIFDFSLCYLCDIFDFTLLDFNQSLSNFRGTDQTVQVYNDV